MSAWQALLGDQTPAHGGTAEPSLAVCDHLAVIRVTGEEAGDYLQGQLTCDLKHIDAGGHRAAMHLSLKGRGLVSVRLLPVAEGYLILCPASQSAATIKSLEKYKLRAKVTFSEAPECLVAGLSGAVSATLADAHLPDPQPGQVLSDDAVTVLRFAHGDLALVIADAEALAAHWPALSGPRRLIDSAGWRFQEISIGEGQIYPGGEDLFLPQVLNYDLLGGVSFKKGCYTGQEVVARMHFKGKLKQRMALFAYQGEPLAAGQPLRNGDGRAVGEVVDSAPGEPSPRLLAVVRLDHQGELYAEEQPLNAEALALPYPLPKPRE
ncbi:CAF17-like 4Fe-4S cluster assembly/insertion protein YgfZ [Alloalcanivorax mobilis]|uniref:CAF17-like 4Fe-4S cluster assembly/insertion protein YgfZ n=1 Tax=Alloalcanivorax mobilis TaxID=2019569 RepID=UPI000C78186A|nr:folate-binding protein YgfZ [Alloalcanivorax mobilis]